MPHRPKGWEKAGYVSKRHRIQNLALAGKSNPEIKLTIELERPGAKVFPSEISAALAPLIRAGRLAPRTNRKAVEVDGKTYPTITDAAYAHGLSIEGARKRLKRGHPSWRYADY